VQTVLEAPEFHDLIGEHERRALSPLFWSNINPYGRFRLDMNTRLDLAGGAEPATESVAGQHHPIAPTRYLAAQDSFGSPGPCRGTTSSSSLWSCWAI